jgi:hypothetical protein
LFAASALRSLTLLISILDLSDFQNFKVSHHDLVSFGPNTISKGSISSVLGLGFLLNKLGKFGK